MIMKYENSNSDSNKSHLYQHNIKFYVWTHPTGGYVSNENDFDSFVNFLNSDHFIPCCGMAIHYSTHFSSTDVEFRYGDSYLINGIRAESIGTSNTIYLQGANITNANNSTIDSEIELPELFQPSIFSAADDVIQIL